MQMIIKPEDSPRIKTWKARFNRVVYFVAFMGVAVAVVMCIALPLAIIGTSCTAEKTQGQRIRKRNTQAIQTLEFYEHKTSGLCFAITSSYRSGYLANVPCNKVQHLLPKKRKKLVAKDIPPILHVQLPDDLPPIIRIHSYKPSPTRVVSPAKDDIGGYSGSLLPKELQWWEKKKITNVAEVLVKGNNLKKLHTLLGVQIKALKICPAIGEYKCIQLSGIVMMTVDRYLKQMMTDYEQVLEMAWWKDSMTAHGVAGVMSYGDNLENLHTFIGKQLRMLKGCMTSFWVVRDNPLCKLRLGKTTVAIDTYFKKVVKEHGGPFIDRNWNKH